MESIPLVSSFQVQSESGSPAHARVVIEPCYPGYGITLGNALRRVLLSSIPGAAPDAVKIRGVSHEFSTIPHVREDVVEIIMNLKSLRVAMHSEERTELKLHVTGKKKVTAKDINCPSDVEITNPNLYLFTTTDDEAVVEITIWVKPGRGYEPVEEKDKRDFELGVIALDSRFSPVKNVALLTENVRVGDRTDFERVVLDVVTDGTMTPEAAVRQSISMLIEQFQAVANQTTTESTFEAPVEELATSDEKTKKKAKKKE